MSVVSKKDLRLGNMFEQGIVWKISGRAGAKVHLHGKGKWYKGFRSEVDVKDLKPIRITEDIIKEWLNGTRGRTGGFYLINGYNQINMTHNGLIKIFDYSFNCIEVKREIEYLHELQNLYYALNKQELEIKG